MDRVNDMVVRHWRWLVLLAWAGYAGWFLFTKQAGIHGFGLGDTDDNMRLVQVRDWLNGQGWYDLRQHRLDPVHGGANIHWSRLVDLPIAGLILSLRPFMGMMEAERWASAIAPLFPLGLMLTSLALLTRRLVDPRAVPLALLALLFAGSTNGMFQPMRVDHHGWQLALLATVLAGLADPKRVRGGIVAGVASALSLAIGLEMMIYLALAGVAHVLSWVADPAERRRLLGYAPALGGGTALAFLVFASEANRAAVCDALSPVWLSDALLASASLLGLTFLRVERWTLRLAVAAAAGLMIAAFHALAFPHCLSRLEGVNAEATQLWLSHVREARPIYRHGWQVAALTLSLPISGLLGFVLLLWRARSNPDLLRRTIAVMVPALAALALLMWQTRTGPAAQMMAIPASIALIFVGVPMMMASGKAWLRVPGTVLVALVGLGALAPALADYLPGKKQTAMTRKVNVANRKCPSVDEMAAVARQPKGVVFTFVDLAPRLIALTHHESIAGPYHRNDQAIADVMKAFRGDADQARRIMAEYGSDYLLICPNMSTATIFVSEAPKGFYGQLAKGQVPAWLTPVDLGKASPMMMWKVVR